MIGVYRFFEKVVENIRLVLFVPLLGLYIFASLATMLFDLWGGALTIHELFVRSPLPQDPLYLWGVAIFLSLATWATTVFAMLLTEDDVDFSETQRRVYSVGRYVLRIADALGDASFLILYGVFPAKDVYSNVVGGILFAIVVVVSLWGDTLVISFARNPARLLKLISTKNNTAHRADRTNTYTAHRSSEPPTSHFVDRLPRAHPVPETNQSHFFGG